MFKKFELKKWLFDLTWESLTYMQQDIYDINLKWF